MMLMMSYEFVATNCRLYTCSLNVTAASTRRCMGLAAKSTVCLHDTHTDCTVDSCRLSIVVIITSLMR